MASNVFQFGEPLNIKLQLGVLYTKQAMGEQSWKAKQSHGEQAIITLEPIAYIRFQCPMASFSLGALHEHYGHYLKMYPQHRAYEYEVEDNFTSACNYFAVATLMDESVDRDTPVHAATRLQKLCAMGFTPSLN